RDAPPQPTPRGLGRGALRRGWVPAADAKLHRAFGRGAPRARVRHTARANLGALVAVLRAAAVRGRRSILQTLAAARRQDLGAPSGRGEALRRPRLPTGPHGRRRALRIRQAAGLTQSAGANPVAPDGSSPTRPVAFSVFPTSATLRRCPARPRFPSSPPRTGASGSCNCSTTPW